MSADTATGIVCVQLLQGFDPCYWQAGDDITIDIKDRQWRADGVFFIEDGDSGRLHTGEIPEGCAILGRVIRWGRAL